MIYTVTLNPSIDRTLHLCQLAVGGLNRAKSVIIHLAGKGVNVSVALRQLGMRSVILGFVGGATGRYLADGLRARGYRCAFLEVEGETRSNLTIIDDETGQITKLNEPGPTVSMSDINALLKSMDGIANDDVCVLSGSLPPGAPSDTYARMVQTLRRQGAFVAVDASGEALKEALPAQPDLIKPNLAEASEALGWSLEGSAMWLDALRALRDRGAGHVVLSLGAQGAVSCGGAEALWARPSAITEASAVGAGDALLAGWLYASERGVDGAERLGWAVACGTAAAMLDGSAMPTREAVEDLRARVKVDSLGDL